MPFTVAELENIANAAIDFHMDRGRVESQTIQDKPLLAAMRAKETTFPGGKDLLTTRVKGVYSTSVQGFEADDTVNYGNPTNIKTASYSWKLLHAGINFTMHELLKDGISIVDTATGKGETSHTDREMTALANILQDKLEDMDEGIDRSMNLMYWRDGTQDATEIPGITSFITNTPSAAAVVGGIDQQANTWWRNRASINFAQGADPSALLVTNLLQRELRQLRRYGGKPTAAFAGSDFIEWMERELRSKGNFTLDGWAKKGTMDMGTADIAFKGLELQYDPTLDDLGRSKFLYLLDMKAIKPKVIEGENWKKHNPARPENKYVFYRAMTYSGGLVCNRRNSNGVYSIQ